MTPFQKQVLVKEEQRQQEQAQSQGGTGSTSPSGALNAKHPRNSGYTETTRYKNENTLKTENQAEFVD